MIKLAYNKANSNLVFKIDTVIRTSMAGGIVEYYEGTLVDTSTVPDTETPGYRVQVMGFESDWLLVPTDIGGTSGVNNQSKTVNASTEDVTVVADKGYTGLSEVKINAVENVEAGNIKSGVTILGVEGTAEVVNTSLNFTADSKSVYVTKSGTAYLYLDGDTAKSSSMSVESSDTSVLTITSVTEVAPAERPYSKHYVVDFEGASVGVANIVATADGAESDTCAVTVNALPTPTVANIADVTDSHRSVSYTGMTVSYDNIDTSTFTGTMTNTGSESQLVESVFVNLWNGTPGEGIPVMSFNIENINETLEPNGTLTLTHVAQYTDLTSATNADISFLPNAPY